MKHVKRFNENLENHEGDGAREPKDFRHYEEINVNERTKLRIYPDSFIDIINDTGRITLTETEIKRIKDFMLENRIRW